MKISVVDLFCGIGGLTHGLKKAGLNVVAGFDIDPTCRYAYEENNGCDFIEADVSCITPREINKYYEGANIRVLVGCAPCQPFSKYTMRYRKNGDINTGKNHNKWSLVKSFAEKIRQILPDVVSMENVPELVNTEVFKCFLNVLTECGYHVSCGIVFCPNYGVPQNRKRLVLLASRMGEIKLIDPEYTSNNYKTVKQAIGNLPKLRNGEKCEKDRLHFCASLNKTNQRRIESSKPGGTWRDWEESLQLDCHKKNTGKSYPSVYGRMSWDAPSPTITTQFYGYGNGRFGHPEQNRALSIREGMILQSFPTDYKLLDEDASFNTRVLGTHIGNAVPVELGCAIGKSIKNHILEVMA